LDDLNLYVFTGRITGEQTSIYFIVCTIRKKSGWMDRVKIGIAKNPAWRVKALQTGNPFSLSLWYHFAVPKQEAARIERSLHRKFRYSRESGEWFVIHKAVREWIKEHKLMTKRAASQRKHILRKRTV